MSWRSGLSEYLFLLGALTAVIAVWWRLGGRRSRYLLIAVALGYGILFCPLPIIAGVLSPRSVMGLILQQPRLVNSGFYASGYSHAAFAKVEPGMTDEEVNALLGDPLIRSKGGDGGQLWIYAWDDIAQPIYVDARVFFDSGSYVSGKRWKVDLD